MKRKEKLISRDDLQNIIKEEIIKARKEQILKEQLNESVLDFFSTIFGRGFNAILDTAKAEFARALLGRIGINPQGRLGRVLVNVFENLDMEEMWDIVTGGGRGRCNTIAQELMEALGESLLEGLPELFGITPNSWFQRVISEFITNSIIRDNNMIQRIADGICNMDIESIFQRSGATGDQTNLLTRALSSVRGNASGAASTAVRLREVKIANRTLNKILLEKKIRHR